MSRTYTLILTRGVHAISAEARELILAAVRARKPYVRIQADLFGSGTERWVNIITAHVVAIADNPELDNIEDPQPTERQKRDRG